MGEGGLGREGEGEEIEREKREKGTVILGGGGWYMRGILYFCKKDTGVNL